MFERSSGNVVHNTPSHIYNTDEPVTVSTPRRVAPLSMRNRRLPCRWGCWRLWVPFNALCLIGRQDLLEVGEVGDRQVVHCGVQAQRHS
jgi:hypothetical protein